MKEEHVKEDEGEGTGSLAYPCQALRFIRGMLPLLHDIGLLLKKKEHTINIYSLHFSLQSVHASLPSGIPLQEMPMSDTFSYKDRMNISICTQQRRYKQGSHSQEAS